MAGVDFWFRIGIDIVKIVDDGSQRLLGIGSQSPKQVSKVGPTDK